MRPAGVRLESRCYYLGTATVCLAISPAAGKPSAKTIVFSIIHHEFALNPPATVQYTRSEKQRSFYSLETSKLHSHTLRRVTMHVHASAPRIKPSICRSMRSQAGCTKVYTEIISGARAERPILDQLLDTLRAGDVLVIWKLDRLGRSLKHLLEIVTDLMTRQVGLKSLNDPIDTTTPQGATSS